MTYTYKDLSDSYEDRICNRVLHLYQAQKVACHKGRMNEIKLLAGSALIGIGTPLLQLGAHRWRDFSSVFHSNLTEICQAVSPESADKAFVVGALGMAVGLIGYLSIPLLKEDFRKKVGNLQTEHDDILREHKNWFPEPRFIGEPPAAANQPAGHPFKDYKL